MAEPQGKPSAAASTVASCSATDCGFNENRNCNAGQITVQMGAQGALCGTYSPRRAKDRP